MTARVADYLPQKINQYVPNMTYSADVVMEGAVRVDLGAPPLLDVNGIILVQDMTVAGETTSFESVFSSAVMGKYGRCVVINAAGATTAEISVFGRDYLGQPMQWTDDLAGTTAQIGLKAFKFIDRITWEAVAEDLIVGWSDRLGLPYNTQALVQELYNASGGGFVEPGTLGAFNAAVATDPATAILGDTRGTVLPDDDTDGTKLYSYLCAVDRANIHGVPQFF